MLLEILNKLDQRMNMWLEILSTNWLRKEHVTRDFKYNLIRKRILFIRFQKNSLIRGRICFQSFYIEVIRKKITFLEMSEKSWLEKEYVVRDFKDTLIRGR